jgi:hypothetical protein
LSHEPPIVTTDEVFDIDKKIRWFALTTKSGQVIVNQMRPGTKSYSPTDVDEEFAQLGPLTLLGVAEKYSDYLKGVEWITVHFGLAVCVYSRLGSQVISVSIEKNPDAITKYQTWLARKRAELNAK